MANLASPNNILGIEYLRALRQSGSAMAPFTIPRIGAGFHEVAAGADGIASATGIRQWLGEGRDISPYLPAAAASPFFRALSLRHTPLAEQHLRLQLSRIFQLPGRLREHYLVDNGIESRLLAAADEAFDYPGLVAAIKSRQLTRTRIQRMLTHILLGSRRSDIETALENGPLYLHLLGTSERGRRFLAACRRQMSLPLVQNFSRIYAILKRRYGVGSALFDAALRQVELETLATRSYTLLLPGWSGRSRNRDFFEEVRSRGE